MTVGVASLQCDLKSGGGRGLSLWGVAENIVLTYAGLRQRYSQLLCGVGVWGCGVLLNAVDKQADRLPDSKTDGSKTERLPDLKTDRLLDSNPGSLPDLKADHEAQGQTVRLSSRQTAKLKDRQTHGWLPAVGEIWTISSWGPVVSFKTRTWTSVESDSQPSATTETVAMETPRQMRVTWHQKAVPVGRTAHSKDGESVYWIT